MKFSEYFDKGMQFLREPSKSFDSVRKEELGLGFRYMLLMSVIVSVLGGIATTAMAYALPALYAAQLPLAGMEVAMLIAAIIGSYVGLIVITLLWGLWLHLWAYILGARQGLEQTMKAVFYGGTPNYLLGWIPFVNIVFGVWTIVLHGIGLMRLQKISGSKAVLTIIIAIAIPGIIALAIFAVLMAFFFSTFGLGAISGLTS